jgi:hypothetical protein
MQAQSAIVRLFADSQLAESERQFAKRLHALHYADVLHELGISNANSGNTVGERFASFELEWPNFKAGQEWAESRADSEKKAGLLFCHYLTGGVGMKLARSKLRGIRRG